MRGTRIFGEAAKELLKKYSQISFTFAGEGPDENWLREIFYANKRVKFIKYSPDETLAIHLAHDIAVVPSLASEGTSLSVAEAMATGCPVVATAVGGITNMIINGYNGILTMPNSSSIQDGIESLIQNSETRQSIGIRAYETAKAAFSIEQWKNRGKKFYCRLVMNNQNYLSHIAAIENEKWKNLFDLVSVSLLIIYLVFLPAGIAGLSIVITSLIIKLCTVNNTTRGIYMLYFGILTLGMISISFGYPGIGGKIGLAIGIVIIFLQLIFQKPCMTLKRRFYGWHGYRYYCYSFTSTAP